MHRIPIHAALVATLILMVPGATAVAQTDSANTSVAYTYTSDLSDVRLFEAWVTDATFTPGVDLEPVYFWDGYESFNLWFMGARVAMWVAEGVEAGGRIGWAGSSPDQGDGDNSFGDLDLYGRYRLPISSSATVAVGAELGLPTGTPEAGQDATIVRIFGALRQDLGGAFTFTANLGFEYEELFGEDGNGIAVGFGSIIPFTEDLAGVLELNLRTAFDYARVTGGVDYELPPGGHLRGAIGIGLDDEAPDVGLQLALSLPVF